MSDQSTTTEAAQLVEQGYLDLSPEEMITYPNHFYVADVLNHLVKSGDMNAVIAFADKVAGLGTWEIFKLEGRSQMLAQIREHAAGSYYEILTEIFTKTYAGDSYSPLSVMSDLQQMPVTADLLRPLGEDKTALALVHAEIARNIQDKISQFTQTQANSPIKSALVEEVQSRDVLAITENDMRLFSAVAQIDDMHGARSSVDAIEDAVRTSVDRFASIMDRSHLHFGPAPAGPFIEEPGDF